MRKVDIHYSLLLDYYGALLPEKQFQIAQLYHNDDLSLSEIADALGITRQGVLDGLERAEKKLKSYDATLSLIQKDRELTESAALIKSYAQKLCENGETELCKKIIAVCDNMSLKG